jgi:epoxyqueuosine reductase
MKAGDFSDFAARRQNETDVEVLVEWKLAGVV